MIMQNGDKQILEIHMQDEKQIWKQIKDPQLTIGKIIPEDLFRHLIINGEKLEELLMYENRRQLLNTVDKILSINGYDLSDVAEFINNRIANMMSDLGMSDFFQFNIENRSNNKWIDELSLGYKKLISLSIIGAVIDCLKQCDKPLNSLEFPLIIDSLFNSIDQSKASTLLTLLSEFASQVIITTGNNQSEQRFKEGLANKSVIFYQLDNCNKGSQIRRMPT